MNRKGLVVLMVLAVLVAGNAFAQMPEFKLSAGAGGYFTSDFGGGWVAPVADQFKFPYAGGGGFVFFDATYAEVSLGFFAAGGDSHEYRGNDPVYKENMSYTGLDIGLLGKYPFALTEQFTLFPLLGMTYRHFISVKNELDGELNNPGNRSALWFKLGVGADYAFTEHIFAHLGVVYGIRLANKWEKNQVKIKSLGGYSIDTRLGHGLDVKLAVGYKF
jgi:opacity protein-like surface antigen